MSYNSASRARTISSAGLVNAYFIRIQNIQKILIRFEWNRF